jgi:catechol 2,3-dioxygenase-like lactoylglutathione lyase family enzyme
LFGSIRQVAFVVRDLDEALRYWTQVLGVGPFFVAREVTPTTYWYRGEEASPPTIHIALGNSGDLQIELIEQLGEEPSAYRDFLDSGREGMHHMSSWVTRAQYDETRARLLAGGMVIAQEGDTRESNTRFAYFATDSVPGGLQYEISDVLDSPIHGLFEALAKMAKEWDGSDPIREGRT